MIPKRRNKRYSILPFAKTVTESVRRYDEKDFPSSLSVLVNAEVSLFFGKAIRFQFCEGRFGVIHFKEASVLCRVATIFGQPDLNAISSEGSGLTRLSLP